MKKQTNILALILLGGILSFTACQNYDYTPMPTTTKAKLLKASASAAIIYDPATANIGGKGYAELSQALGKWMFEPHYANSPLGDPDGSRHAESNQPLPDVMLLASNFGGTNVRSLTFPANKPVFLQTMGIVTWFFEDPSCSPAQNPLFAQSNNLFAQSSGISNRIKDLSIKLDGEELLSDYSKFKLSSGLFQILVANDYAATKCNPGSQLVNAVMNGYNVLLQIPEGQHVLHFYGKNGSIYSDITWNLTVVTP